MPDTLDARTGGCTYFVRISEAEWKTDRCHLALDRAYWLGNGMDLTTRSTPDGMEHIFHTESRLSDLDMSWVLVLLSSLSQITKPDESGRPLA